MRRALVPFSIVLFAGVAAGQPSRAPTASIGGHVSVGFPNAGKLEGGKKWSDTRAARHLRRRAAGAAFAMPGLVALLQNAAQKVAAHFPRSVLTVGDMSARDGGPLSGHHSHQNGRDADVGFYVMNDRGKAVVPGRFLAFDEAGKSTLDKHAFFDDARNWALVQALLTDGRAEVRTIFVAGWLKARLLKEGARAKAPRDVLERAAAIMMQPANAEPHDDHFHVRIACVESQRGTVCHDDSIERGGGSLPGGLSAPSEPDPP